MKFSRIFLSGIILLLQSMVLVCVAADNHGIYYAELEAFKNAPVTKLMFDEDAHVGLSEIQRDIITYKKLTNFQRFVRADFLALDVIIVTPEIMPHLYEYVDGICKKACIITPTIFITRQDGFFNAFAQKLLMSTGGIVIGQKLIKELSDDAIEAIIAHEIGHIKYNHINKMLALWVGQIIATMKLCQVLKIELMITKFDSPDAMLKLYAYCAKVFAIAYVLSYISPLIINKRFEKEADKFAYEANGKGKGIIEFFELMLKKDQLREEEFASVYELLQQNKSNLSTFDYYELVVRYYLAKFEQSYTNFYKKIYYETFIGAHPSPEARIAAAKEHLAKQQV